MLERLAAHKAVYVNRSSIGRESVVNRSYIETIYDRFTTDFSLSTRRPLVQRICYEFFAEYTKAPGAKSILVFFHQVQRGLWRKRQYRGFPPSTQRHLVQIASRELVCEVQKCLWRKKKQRTSLFLGTRRPLVQRTSYGFFAK